MMPHEVGEPGQVEAAGRREGARQRLQGRIVSAQRAGAAAGHDSGSNSALDGGTVDGSVISRSASAASRSSATSGSGPGSAARGLGDGGAEVAVRRRAGSRASSGSPPACAQSAVVTSQCRTARLGVERERAAQRTRATPPRVAAPHDAARRARRWSSRRSSNVNSRARACRGSASASVPVVQTASAATSRIDAPATPERAITRAAAGPARCGGRRRRRSSALTKDITSVRNNACSK